MRILVVNAGSSSLKLSIIGPADSLDATDEVAVGAGGIDAEALRDAVGRWGRLDAAGHRIVHGGTRFIGPALVDAHVERELRALTDLAPLHQPGSLAALRAARDALPGIPHVACFDTAFHAGMPAEAATYAIPAEWRERWPVRRFGFHGLSHAYASRRAAAMLDRDAAGFRVVTCHLGAGASLAAVLGGRSVDTTMGFTPLEGLVMATRSGSVDPGLLLWLGEHARLPVDDLSDALEHRSGLLGLAGSADLRAVLDAESAGEPRATLAVGVYLHRLAAEVAAMAAALGGLDALVFTGGAGERAWSIRRRAVERLAFLGVSVDERRNQEATPDADVSGEGAAARTLVITAREDLEIARQVRGALGARADP